MSLARCATGRPDALANLAPRSIGSFGYFLALGLAGESHLQRDRSSQSHRSIPDQLSAAGRPFFVSAERLIGGEETGWLGAGTRTHRACFACATGSHFRDWLRARFGRAARASPTSTSAVALGLALRSGGQPAVAGPPGRFVGRSPASRLGGRSPIARRPALPLVDGRPCRRVGVALAVARPGVAAAAPAHPHVPRLDRASVLPRRVVEVRLDRRGRAAKTPSDLGDRHALRLAEVPRQRHRPAALDDTVIRRRRSTGGHVSRYCERRCSSPLTDVADPAPSDAGAASTAAEHRRSSTLRFRIFAGVG
jgi:hypothetical protein